MKQTAQPPLSPAAFEALVPYKHFLREREDPTMASNRNYLSDLRYYIACYETEQEAHVHKPYTLYRFTMPILIGYRTYLQIAQRQKPDSLETTKLYTQGTKQDLQQAAQPIAWT